MLFSADDALRELQQLTFNKFETLGNECSFVALIIKGRHCQMKVGEMEPVSLNYKLEIGEKERREVFYLNFSEDRVLG